MEWHEDEDEARTGLYEQDEYQMYSGNPLDDPNYVPNTEMVRAIYATDYYMVQVRGGHDELERAERFDRWLAAEKAKWQAEALREAVRDARATWEGNWNLRDPRDPDVAYSVDRWLEIRADRIEKGSDDER